MILDYLLYQIIPIPVVIFFLIMFSINKCIYLFFHTACSTKSATMKCTITDMKIVLLGKEFVGKTRLVDRYLNERFTWDMTYQNVSFAKYSYYDIFCCFSDSNSIISRLKNNLSLISFVRMYIVHISEEKCYQGWYAVIKSHKSDK